MLNGASRLAMAGGSSEGIALHVLVFGLQDIGQHMGEPLGGIDPVQLAHAQQRIDHSSTPGPFVRAGEQVVFAPQCQRTDRILHQIVINFQQPVMQVRTEGVPAPGTIGHGLADLAFGQYRLHFRTDPGSQLIDDGKRAGQTKLLSLVR